MNSYHHITLKKMKINKKRAFTIIEKALINVASKVAINFYAFLFTQFKSSKAISSLLQKASSPLRNHTLGS